MLKTPLSQVAKSIRTVLSRYKLVVKVRNEFMNVRSLCQRAPIDLELEKLITNSATGAVYNSLERQQLDAPKCHPNTRVAVINRTIDWLLGKIEFDALILWLYGAAGAGKSAIAHSIAEICEERGWLLATFFFWKTAAERNSIARFVTTVAYQI